MEFLYVRDIESKSTIRINASDKEFYSEDKFEAGTKQEFITEFLEARSEVDWSQMEDISKEDVDAAMIAMGQARVAVAAEAVVPEAPTEVVVEEVPAVEAVPEASSPSIAGE